MEKKCFSQQIISEKNIRANLPAEFNEINILVFDTISSTNTKCKQLAQQGQEHRTLVISREQTAGRGRSGNSFFSPKDTGLYMSLLLRSDLISLEPQQTTVAAAVAACRGIERLTGQKPKIKWVNDLYLNGKKICGILAEAITDAKSAAISGVVVGIGINCTTAAESFPYDIARRAGSLSTTEMSISPLAALITDELLTLAENGSFPEILNEYRERSLIHGKQISFRYDGSTICAKVIEIDSAGNLAVQLQNGEIMVLSSGEVSIMGDFTE